MRFLNANFTPVRRPSGMEPQYTIAEFAATLGIDPRSVRQQLRRDPNGPEPTRSVKRDGAIKSAVYSISALRKWWGSRD